MANISINGQLEKLNQITNGLYIPIIDNNSLKSIEATKLSDSQPVNVDLSIITTDIQNIKNQIEDIKQHNTAPTVVDNGPWDVDVTSKFVKGNVNISPSAMWTINQGYKRVYLETKLNQGDVIKIPNTIRMYIGWKNTSGQFGQANWTQAGTTYTATVDGDYVILLDTPSVNNPWIEPATLSSFGNVMLHTSNVAYKPNAGGSQPSGTTQTVVLPKDHTRDDLVMRGIAHQGYHTTERANSLAAFRAAAKEGWRYGIVHFGKIGSSFSEWTSLLNEINQFNTNASASKAYLFADVNIDNLKTAEVGATNKLSETGCALEVQTAKTEADLNELDPYVTGVTSDNIHAGEILAKKI